MFPGNNIASVGVKLSCLHTEGVFTAVDTLHKQTQEQCTLYYFSVVSLSWMKWRLELICIVVLSYQRKNCFAWLHKYSQTETRIFYPRPVLYVINSVGPGTVNLESVSRLLRLLIPSMSQTNFIGSKFPQTWVGGLWLHEAVPGIGRANYF